MLAPSAGAGARPRCAPTARLMHASANGLAPRRVAEAELEDEDAELSVTIESVMTLTQPEAAMPRKSERERYLQAKLGAAAADHPIVATGPEARLMEYQLEAEVEALNEQSRLEMLELENGEDDVLVEAEKVKYHR